MQLLYKYYGGIEWFDDKPFFLLTECLKHSIEKENELPKLLNMALDYIEGNKEIEPINKHMRSAEEIMKDYGLAGEEV